MSLVLAAAGLDVEVRKNDVYVPTLHDTRLKR